MRHVVAGEGSVGECRNVEPERFGERVRARESDMSTGDTVRYVAEDTGTRDDRVVKGSVAPSPSDTRSGGAEGEEVRATRRCSSRQVVNVFLEDGDEED